MSYKVTAPLVIIPNADGASTDWYGYADAVVPTGLNDERCKRLVKEGMLEEFEPPKDDDAPAPDSVKGILAEVGDDKVKAQAALDAEKAADKPRATLVEALEKVLA